MAKMMGKARWWGAWSFNGDDYNAGQRAAEKREWQAQAEAESRAELWDAYYADAYRHMHEDSGIDHEASDRAARDWANRMVL